MVAGAVAAPMLIDLGEHDSLAVIRAHRLADADRGYGLDVLGRCEVADAQLEPLRAVIVRQRRQQLPVRARLQRSKAEIMIARRLGRLVEDQLVRAAAYRLVVPALILRSGLESPPVEPVAVADRDRAVVLLDSPLHLLEQPFDQLLVLPRPGFEISILRMEIGEHVGVGDLGIFRVAQPVPRVLDRHSMALVAVGPLLGLRRRRNFDRLVHVRALSAVGGYGKSEAAMRMSALGGKGPSLPTAL